MVMMKSSQGTTVSVSEDKAERLRALGYKNIPMQTDSAPKKRGRPKKAADSKPLEEILGEDDSEG